MGKKYLSANTLFHFTSNIGNIINILKNEFSPRYCMEKFEFIGSNNLEIAIPMVCFCDIQLAQIVNHIENYGGYGIGLSKEWGVSNGINPVTYSIKGSIATEAISKLECDMKTLVNSGKITGEVLTNVSQSIGLLSHFIFFMKPYEGQAWSKKSFDGKHTRFYDEREWRYIPDLNHIRSNGTRWFLNKDEYLNDDFRIDSNIKIAEISKLSFSPDDIKYIIVNSEDEILKVCREIDNIKGDNYPQNKLNILKTRIISKEQILSDF
ncbi:abortive infection system antitoxin AbiGi family protein [Clostridium sp. UBA1056]|uniref:abortive infection system antitoxin AbiGi family protein n=1 Tax=unclassified Clostridium TaxID=2614128 RepID=UPI0032175AA3